MSLRNQRGQANSQPQLWQDKTHPDAPSRDRAVVLDARGAIRTPVPQSRTALILDKPRERA